MVEIVKLNRQRALNDPEAEFDMPADLAECVGLTRGEKISSLERWQFLVGRRLESAGEGMGEHPPGDLVDDAELLSEIGRQLERTRSAVDLATVGK